MGQVVMPAVWSRVRTSRRKWRWGAVPVRDPAMVHLRAWHAGMVRSPSDKTLEALVFGRTGRP